jgi:hypothetical protein
MVNLNLNKRWIFAKFNHLNGWIIRSNIKPITEFKSIKTVNSEKNIIED